MMPAVKEQLKLFFTNPIFLACLFSWLSAQFLKTIINLIYGRIHSVGELMENLVWRTGGMPSSHTAVVVSVCTTIGFRSGIDSDVFILSFCLMLITVRDALGVRRATGLQAMKINEIGRYLSGKDDIEISSVKEIQGHKPMEVIGGAALGLLIGVLFSLFLKA